MNETSIKHPTKLYAFISGHWEKHVVYVKAESASTALNIYCKYCGMTDHRLEAITLVSLESAIKLANAWLNLKIVDIHEVGNTVYFDEEYGPQTIGQEDKISEYDRGFMDGTKWEAENPPIRSNY